MLSNQHKIARLQDENTLTIRRYAIL